MMAVPFASACFSRLRAFLPAAVLLCVLSAALSVPAASAAPQTIPQAAPTPAQDAKDPETAKDPFSEVIAKAKMRASLPYEADRGMAPDYLRALTESQWHGIRFKPEQAVWNRQKLPFEIELYHPGFIFTHSVAINVVSPAGTEALAFSPDMFAYGNKALADKIRQSPPGFAGFRIMHPLHGPSSRDAVTSFLGASYFRGMGRHSRFGLHSRGLAVNTALPDGEEFPHFREFWFVTPKPEDKTLVICALMDSPNTTGAFRYAITPGTSTVMDVEARVFLRNNAAWPQKIGLAPLTSMFLYAETGNGWPGEYRPEIHNSDGLLFSSGADAWTWSPLSNPTRLAVNTFPMEAPRGFGLFQRDDNFDHYQDMDARFDQRPSVWVEPQGDWGPGRIELIEIPSTEEIHDNIVAFWVPDSTAPAEGGADGAPNGAADAGVLSYAYKLFWMTPGVTPHALGRVTATRIVKRADTARFIIDFESEALKALPAETGLTSLIEAPESAPIIEKQLAKNPATGGWRLSFSIKLPHQDNLIQNIISAREGSPRLRFRALLKKGENLPDPLTEEWVYDLPS